MKSKIAVLLSSTYHENICCLHRTTYHGTTPLSLLPPHISRHQKGWGAGVHNTHDEEDGHFVFFYHDSKTCFLIAGCTIIVLICQQAGGQVGEERWQIEDQQNQWRQQQKEMTDNRRLRSEEEEDDDYESWRSEEEEERSKGASEDGVRKKSLLDNLLNQAILDPNYQNEIKTKTITKQ